MEQSKIDRINVLARKSKSEGLTEEEKTEQAILRQEYIKSFRRNIISTMEGVSVEQEDGSIKHMSDVRKEKGIEE